jgi:hypothetical protein
MTQARGGRQAGDEWTGGRRHVERLSVESAGGAERARWIGGFAGAGWMDWGRWVGALIGFGACVRAAVGLGRLCCP